MKVEWLWVLVLLLCNPAFSSVPMTNNQCVRGETCETKDNCPQVQAKYEEYNTTKNRTILNELKSYICNTEKRGFCCPPVSSLPMTTKQCARGETCESKVDIEEGNVVCPYIQTRLLSDYKTSRNQTIITELKSATCNRESKGFCCPAPSVSVDPSVSLDVDISPRERFTCEAPRVPSSASSVSKTRVERCGGANTLVPQIFGGQEAKGQFPFMVAFVTRDSLNPFCGGVLVTRECIT